MITRPHAPDVNTLTRANTFGSIVFAVVFGGFTLFVICVAWLVSYFVEAPIEVFKWFVLVAAGLGVLSVGSIIALGVWNWRDVIQSGIDWADREIKHKFPTTLVTPPTLPSPYPTPDETFKHTSGSRVEDRPKELLHGFDPRDLQVMCNQIADGMKWTETQLEYMRLPYSDTPIGKAQPGSVYTKLFGVPDGIFIRAGIIGDRMGTKTGTLKVLNASEMMDKLRGL